MNDLVICDMDGVITTQNSFYTFARTLRPAPRDLLTLGATMAVHAAARAVGRSGTRWAARGAEHLLAGMDEREYDSRTAPFARAFAGKCLRPEVISELRRLHADEARIVIATASEESLAAQVLASGGVTYDALSATRFVWEPQCRVSDPRFAERKASALVEAGYDLASAVLVTDSSSDLALARMCRRTILIAPNTRTVRRMRRARIDFAVWENGPWKVS